jgi:dihydroneopterin aldolase
MNGHAADRIVISGLELAALFGALPGEKEHPQRLVVSVELTPLLGFSGLADRLDRAVNYAAVCDRIREHVAGLRPDLLETVADEIAAMILREFSVKHVVVEARKFVPVGADFVAVKIERECPAR